MVYRFFTPHYITARAISFDNSLIIILIQAAGDLEYDGRVQVINGNLTIQGLQKSDHGIYECEASNEVRKIVTTTELIIQSK